MSHARRVKLIRTRQPVIEGAGVRLKRVFSSPDAELMDPFLLLDEFGSDNPADYLSGFPWHPHRGIETVTYMIAGTVEHGDSLGNSGVIGSGDIQWMTAGRGIIHQEMPKRFTGRSIGLQLWINLPRTHKMIPPRYRDIRHDAVVSFSLADGVTVKLIAGRLADRVGPVRDVIANPVYFDASFAPDIEYTFDTPPEDTVLIYVLDGSAKLSSDSTSLQAGQLALLTRGDHIRFCAGAKGARIMFMAGMPIHEPIAWQGPIVMNTQEELELAFQQYADGTFI